MSINRVGALDVVRVGGMTCSRERAYDGVKVFSSTMVGQRGRMGDDVMAWLRAHPECVPVDKVVRQSSDSRFHCLTIVIFWRSTPP